MKRGQGGGGPYCGLLRLEETAGWAGVVVFSPHVTAALGGSPTAVTVTTGSRHSGDATWPVARPRAAAK
jgi:hypothetical protein